MHTHNIETRTEAQKIAVALLWLEDMRRQEKWNLTLDEACILMGSVSRNTYKSWVRKAKNNNEVTLSRDTITRLSLLLGIHKALALSAPQGYEFDFFKRPIDHPLFQGKSAKEQILIDSDILFINAVRNHFDARRA
ncbi:hypothetical protein [Marinomonas algicola]|uniref:hypothetical protein n=1 Tax=Marinomonas algicola TaxID=2773454 RepID=UPI0017493251|nr:hypothetical protein [Marinomonas algicola]